ncbi:MAG: hypothetical protein ACI9SP_002012 [Arenicella sp.]
MTGHRLNHHQAISSALKKFNNVFLQEHNIIFGGGTRIALEINEFRESVDIDFLCPNKESYKAVREQATNISLGLLVKQDFKYLRPIVFDRYAVRTWIEHEGSSIKLEFVSFDNYELKSELNTELFPIPALDHNSCYYTKLLANADRKLAPPHKDIIDLLAMRSEWGRIPNNAIDLAVTHYGRPTVIGSMIKALEHIQKNVAEYKQNASDLSISREYANVLIDKYVPILLSEARQDLSE